jgi:hypothetical protein
LVVSADNAAIGTLTFGTGASGNDECTAAGSFALGMNTSGGIHNSAFGYLSLESVTSGDNNTAIGSLSGVLLDTGSSNTYLGYNTSASSGSVSNEVVIGAGLTGKGSNTSFVAGSSGVYNGKNQTLWDTVSDERLKKNICDNNVGLDVINKVRVRNFEYRLPDEIEEIPRHEAVRKSGLQIGVIAQEFEEALPDSVVRRSTGALSVSADSLVWYLVNAIKELSDKVSRLEAEK